MSIPVGVDTLIVRMGCLRLDGSVMKGSVTFVLPALLTFVDGGTIVGGVLYRIPDDTTGDIVARVISPWNSGMTPRGWTVRVTEQFQGQETRSYSVLLPNLPDGSEVKLTKFSPVETSAGVPTSQGPPGASAYELAVSQGFVGTEAQWLASLVGPPGSSGSGVPLAYTQSAAAAVWTIPHTYPYRPLATTWDTSGREIGGTVDHPDPATVTVTFGAPETGTAAIR